MRALSTPIVPRFEHACGKRRDRRIIVGLILSSLFTRTPLGEERRTPTFQQDVLPLFESRCVKCHGGEKPKARLDLRTLPTVLAGSEHGPVVAAGQPEKSRLWEMVNTGKMPHNEEPLARAELELIRQWIEKGQFSSSGKSNVVSAATSISGDARRFWSFRKPVKPAVPRVHHSERARTPIDAFVLQKLEELGLTLNPDASRPMLIRRVYFDLIGLPPSPEEVEAFVNDPSPKAYEALVNRLLASPHYGERWARHWLDVAGYSDSSGFLGDPLRPEAWKYRDYVIRSLNEDKPYDQFLIEQLAGDELVDWRGAEELTPEMIEKIVATGFLRCAPDGTDNQAITQEDKRWDALRAAVEVALKATVGLQMNCARCHDHKFDPVPQEDYYRLLAVFQPAYDPYNWIAANNSIGARWPARYVLNAGRAEAEQYAKVQAEAPLRIRAKRIEQRNLIVAYRERWCERQLDKLDEGTRAAVREALAIPRDQRNAEAVRLIGQVESQFPIQDELLEKEFPELAGRVAKINAEIQADEEALKAKPPEMIWALWDVSARPPVTHLLKRGDFQSPGDPVEPGILSVLDDPKNPFRFPAPDPAKGTTGRRLALARWLTQPDHPLTARVLVNRIWQYHFGRGLVKTPDDFGSQGARPTHPELLDWMAVTFVENGWSLKKLHREILLSGVYRQSSSADPDKSKLDPTNALLWRKEPRRLEAEVIRDALLAVSGQLDRKLFGPPVPVTKLPDGQFVADTSHREAHRRTLYVQNKRLSTVSLLSTFDAPQMDSNAPLRFTSTVPQQSLALMNNPLVIEAAERFAERVVGEGGADSPQRANRAFQLAFGRPAASGEISLVLAFLNAQEHEKRAWKMLTHALLAANEFLYVD